MKRAPIEWVQPLGFGNAAARASVTSNMARPRSVIPLAPRDEAVFLLHTAAEIEHSLLVQYLYAAYSMGEISLRSDIPDDLQTVYTEWQKKIRGIAVEEMAHLVTVQNVLLALGGPLNFDREDYPFRSDFYPFRFALRPLSKDVLAKSVAAEMPALDDVPDAERHDVIGIVRRATAANEDIPINRVAPLYDQIIDLIGLLDPDYDFVFGTAGTLQAQPVEWGSTPNQTTGRIIWLIDSQAKAQDALRAVKDQGEGPTDGGGTESHFRRFLDIYNDPLFPETNPRYGPIGHPLPALPVATNPNTLPRRRNSREQERGRITNRCTRYWAYLFNLRYRMLLHSLQHYFGLPFIPADNTGATPPNCRQVVLSWMITNMKLRLPALAKLLTSKPRKHPNEFVDGRLATAGAPFELPYSLAIAQGSTEHWMAHRDMARASSEIIALIQGCTSDPDDLTLLDDLTNDDRKIAAVAKSQIQDPSGQCQAVP
jgi:hypothetical protein